MEFAAIAVLLTVGAMLIAVNCMIYKQLTRGDALVWGRSTLAFSILLTVAYYLSLAIVLL